MTRRDILTAAGSAALISRLAPEAKGQAIANPKGALGMGGSPTAWSNRRSAMGGGRGPASFSGELLDYCHSLGFGGAELGVPPPDADSIAKFKDKLQTYKMHVIFNVPLPRTEADVEPFDLGVRDAKAAGAYGLHAALTGRRYEDFDSIEAYHKSFAVNQKMVELAAPVLNKHQVRLAIENHKGWRAVEQAAWLKKVNSDYVGVHLDFGNNVSFLEDPMFTLETLKPWIFSGHIKDMGIQPYEEGFLLSEVPFGDGFLDLRKMVDILRAKDPKMIFDLEMITRDPLKVPIYTDKYWATFGDVPPQQVAKFTETLEKHAATKPLPKVSGLDRAARQKLELDYNLACLRYAREKLDL